MGETVGELVRVDDKLMDDVRRDGRDIKAFITIDRIGAVGGALLVLAANGIFLNEPLLWIVFAAVVALVGALTLAKRQLANGSMLSAISLVTVGNWLCAVTVSAALPFLWPVMVLTVLMPMVLITPYLSRRHLTLTLAAGAVLVGLVSSIGLLNDDGGALPDIDDDFELPLVVGSVMAQLIPIGLIVWQNNRLQQQDLAQVVGLNRELVQYQERLAASGRRVVEAADSERRRIERNLHDGAQQRLVALGVRLRLLESRTEGMPEVKEEVERLVSELDAAVEEVRELAHGIYPPLLQSRGLGDALRSIARRSSVPVDVTIDDDIGRHHESVETAIYFAALEALTNAAKHAPDAEVALSLLDEGSQLRLSVSDNGPGFVVSDEIQSQGTHNMGDRVAAVDGKLTITSDLGAGTTVTAVVPTERS